MAYSGPFNADDLGPAWEQYRQLAQFLEDAGLSAREAQVCLLLARGCSKRAVAAHFGVWEFSVRKAAARAKRRIRQNLPTVRDEFRQYLWALLACAQNRRLTDTDLLIVLHEAGAAPLHARRVTVDDLDGPGSDPEPFLEWLAHLCGTLAGAAVCAAT